MSLEEDENKFLERALEAVKTMSNEMKNSIDKNDIRQCLRDASEMISELKTSLLSPKNYYQLYTSIFDEIQYLQNYFREESKKGRRIKDLYEAVQNCVSIVPRVFLLIIVGGIFIESQQCDSEELITDLMQNLKGIQNPLRGLFIRYFFLKMMKDYFPCCYIKNNNNNNNDELIKTINFIIDNFNEMNKLWIRINDSKNEHNIGNNYTNQEIQKDYIVKYRNDLKILIGENITRLAYLDNLTLDLYKTNLLPMILDIIDKCKDHISQQYLIDCIINAFPDEYNIKCINELVNTINKLEKEVDTNSIYENIIEKASSKNNVNLYSQEDLNILIKLVGDTINNYSYEIDSLIDNDLNSKNNNISNSTEVKVLKLTELHICYLKLIIQSAKNEEKITYINNILNQSYYLLNKIKGENKMNKKGIELIMNLLTLSLESPVSIFDIKSFPDLLGFLDDNNRFILSLKIINKLVNDYNIGLIDNKDKMLAVVELVKPLIVQNLSSNNNNSNNILNNCYNKYMETDNDIRTLSKIAYIPCSKDPYEQVEILTILKGYFTESKNEAKLNHALISIINSLLILGYKLNACYKYQILKKDTKTYEAKKIKKDFATYYEIESFKIEENNEELTEENSINKYKEFYKNLYLIISQYIDELININSDTAVKLLCDASIHSYKVSIEKLQEFFEDFCINFMNKSINIINEGKVKSEKKLNLISYLIGNFISLKNISKDNIKNIRNSIYKLSLNLIKRSEQCIAMLNCIQMYNKDCIDNIIECLNKAKKFADYAMTSPENAMLFVKIINEYIKCDLLIENFNEKANVDNVNDLIEYLKNYLVTLKIEKNNYEISAQIEIFFNSTLETIINYKKINKGKLISKIKTSDNE